MKLKGILFDLDGTVLDTSGLIVASFQHTFKVHYGIELEPEKIYPFFGMILKTAMETLGPDKNPEDLMATYRDHHRKYQDEMMATFPAVPETLKALHKAGIKMAIVTSRRKETAIHGLRLLGLDSYFPVVIGEYQCEKHKPDPEPVNLALRLLDLTAKDCLMVGDSPADLSSGHRANMPVAAVKWTYMDWKCLADENPEYVLETMADLLKLI